METEVVTADNISLIKERLTELNTSIYDLVQKDLVQIGDESIFIDFPEEFEGIYYSISDVLKYTKDIKTIKKVSENTVRTTFIRQTILNIDIFVKENSGITNVHLKGDGFTVNLVTNPFLIGCIATKEGIYNLDIGVTPCSYYTAIEIVYSDPDKILQPEQEDKLISRILFYLCNRYVFTFEIGSFASLDEVYERIDVEELEEDEYLIKEEDLLNYSLPMDMYRDALTISNDEIRFLYFYKIIEYYSPLVAKQKAYAALNQRLDTLGVHERNLTYLESFFTLTRQYDTSMKDGELANTVLQDCVDILTLYPYLPETIKKKARKSLQANDIDERLTSEKVSQLKMLIAKMLYETRNNIVHAKSNYARTDNECESKDLGSLNIFMRKLSYCLISWHARLPKEMRLE